MAQSGSSRVPAPRIRIVDLAAFTRGLDEAVAQLHAAEGPLPGDPDPNTPKLWRSHFPDLNQACADSLEEAHQLVDAGGLKFTVQALRDNGQRLADLTKARGRAVEVVDQIDREIDVCRRRMLHHTDQVLTLARTRINDPTREDAFHDQVRRVFSRPFEIVDQASLLLAGTRRANRMTREQIATLQENVSRSDLENRTLRGDKLTADDVRPTTAPKAARRPRRRRR